MNVLILPLEEITVENVFFMDSKKNILMDGTFTKLIFMNEWFTMNGIYLDFPIEIQKIEPISSQKHTVYFSVYAHPGLLEEIEHLERSILDKYVSNTTAVPIYSLQHTLRMGYFKIFSTSRMKGMGFTLKISGIWENAKNYGISYKITEASYI